MRRRFRADIVGLGEGNVAMVLDDDAVAAAVEIGPGIGKASRLDEEVYILDGAYYNGAGRIVAGPGTFMFNAPGAVHGGISCDLTLFIHCCSGEPDELLTVELIDFEPKEQPNPTGTSPA